MKRKFSTNLLNNILLKSLFIVVILSCFFVFESFAQEMNTAESKKPICAIYLTGIGCSNCAKTDPFLFTDVLEENPRLIIFEYEVFRHRKENVEVKENYFHNFLPGKPMGVPCIIFNEKSTSLGSDRVLKSARTSSRMSSNPFYTPDGQALDFDNVDIAKLPGKVVIWTKNRVLISGKKGNSEILRKVLLADDITSVLEGVKYRNVFPTPVAISKSELNFEHAVMLGDWKLQWNGGPSVRKASSFISMENSMFMLLGILILLGIALSFFRVRKTSKGAQLKFELKARMRDIVIVGISFLALVLFFVLAKNISSDFLEETGYSMPLPIFTFLIALVDGFNPCNMFVLTCLLALLISTSDSKKRLYAVAFSFVSMVYVFYFMFMAAWLEAMKYIGFITPLRIALALMALTVGIINCKELFFFKKGLSLTISDKQKGPLMKRMQGMREIIKNGSFPLLITSSLGLAALASLVELPCTAGFPIVYTGILAGKGLENSLGYYGYLFYYNLVYVLPLIVIIVIFIYTFRARQITQRQMEIIKFIGGIIMILLGIVLLVNPGLLGLGIG